MASTTFSGPIKAGTISNTTGTTLGDDVKNVGQVVMCQSVDLDQTATATDVIVIPANSQIIDCIFDCNLAGGASTISTWFCWRRNSINTFGGVAGGTLGIIGTITAGALAWEDIGTSDQRILLTNTQYWCW